MSFGGGGAASFGGGPDVEEGQRCRRSALLALLPAARAQDRADRRLDALIGELVDLTAALRDRNAETQGLTPDQYGKLTNTTRPLKDLTRRGGPVTPVLSYYP